VIKNKRKKKPPRSERWKDFVGRSNRELAGIDIAQLNLLCAGGLPGTDLIDVHRNCKKLDNWARHVRRETERNRHRFERERRSTGDTLAKWHVGMMITVLQQDLGVRYNPDRIRDPDFRDGRDLFVSGVISGRGGTCVSMPVVYVAIGRRLKYPLRLVTSKAHLFCRWDDAAGDLWPHADRFNIEGSSRGFTFPTDEQFHTSPTRLTAAEIAGGYYLNSLSPRQELAGFLASRSHCLEDNGRIAEAMDAIQAAVELAPQTREYGWFLDSLVTKRSRAPNAGSCASSPR